jgi:hypothetical protein
MTPEEVAGCLARMNAAWPWAELNELTFDVWAEAMTGVDGQDAVTAARRLVTSEERPPSIARFLEECRLVKRNRGPALMPGHVEPALTKDESAERLAAIRRGLKVAAAMVPEHRHGKDPGVGKHGPVDAWKSCPACSTERERRGALQEAIRAELAPAHPYGGEE